MYSMENLLRKKPNPSGGFKWMVDWENVARTPKDDEAFRAYLNGEDKHCNLQYVNNHNSAAMLLTFLRYDYKKTLVRTRYLYIDRIRKNDHQIGGSDLDQAYFEPILLCFPTLEFIGRLLFSQKVEWTHKSSKTKEILRMVFGQMGNGYSDYSKQLVSLHRHALSHELRPDGVWTYDLNTENKYGSPRQEGSMLYLNIAHFIDSSIVQLENVCDALTGDNPEEIMNGFSVYIEKKYKDKQ